jgi:hypothetical protein
MLVVAIETNMRPFNYTVIDSVWENFTRCSAGIRSCVNNKTRPPSSPAVCRRHSDDRTEEVANCDVLMDVERL